MTTQMNCLNDFQMIRPVPYMGVIWVNHKAQEMGFVPGDKSWCNLGQGQPEEGLIEGAPERFTHLDLTCRDYAYGPVGGIPELRQAVADMMNRLYRVGKVSQYGPQNVTVAAGGRVALTRLFSILSSQAKVLYRNPDYTAYEDLMAYQREHLQFVCENTRPQDGFNIRPARLRELIDTEGVNTFVLSNPNNPTGSLVRGNELKEYCRIAREKHMLLALDEFYSHYVYEDGEGEGSTVSAARYVEDVESDPVIMIDGLTKNLRYPGFRVSWIVGPSRIIEAINRAASAIDGGTSVPMQRLACEALRPEALDEETKAVQRCFAQKREYVVRRLNDMGVQVTMPPHGAFYVWADISGLPEPLCVDEDFCLNALEYHVMTIPGRFFDIRPNGDRISPEPMRHFIRFSFGPKLSVLKEGLDRIEKMIEDKRYQHRAA